MTIINNNNTTPPINNTTDEDDNDSAKGTELFSNVLKPTVYIFF